MKQMTKTLALAVQLENIRHFLVNLVHVSTLSQTSPGFYVSAEQVFKKTLVKKLLIMSNFFFSHSVSYLFGEISAIFIKLEDVVCKPFQFRRV